MRNLCLLLAAVTLSAIGHADDKEKWDLKKIDTSKLPAASTKKGLTFAKDVKPLFEASCVRCHGDEKQKGDLRLDSLDALLKGGKDGKVIVPGDSKKSLLVAAAAHVNDDVAMPPKFKPRGPGGPGAPGGPGGPGQSGGQGRGPGQNAGGNPGGPRGPGGQGGPGGPPAKPLTPAEVGVVRAWIDQGAK